MRDWLKEKRLEKGLTMAEMAKKLDISEGYYSRIEDGSRQKDMNVLLALKISQALGMSLQEIVDAENA